MQVAIDSSVLVGLLVPNDLWHTHAVTLWNRVEENGHTGIYFDCVAAEAISVVVRRLCEKGLVAEVDSSLNRVCGRKPPIQRHQLDGGRLGMLWCWQVDSLG